MMLYYPPRCLRGCNDCRPLAAIESDGPERTFICMGENDGKNLSVPTDRLRFCQRTNDGVNILINHDRRDIADWMSVLAQGVSMLENEATDPDFVPTYGDAEQPPQGGSSE